jgi:hypothetical protein
VNERGRELAHDNVGQRLKIETLGARNRDDRRFRQVENAAQHVDLRFQRQLLLRTKGERQSAVQWLDLVEPVEDKDDLASGFRSVDQFGEQSLVHGVVALVGADEVEKDLGAAQRVAIQRIVLDVQCSVFAETW